MRPPYWGGGSQRRSSDLPGTGLREQWIQVTSARLRAPSRRWAVGDGNDGSLCVIEARDPEVVATIADTAGYARDLATSVSRAYCSFRPGAAPAGSPGQCAGAGPRARRGPW
ncbi:hypothetical protein HOK021_36410 [Streptomyces hygroscopicus]|nr:hypothetical protein HOK021_36410 [Streptomyces hygroscopicus]